MGITNAEHRNYKTLGEEIEQETTQTAVPCLSRDATTTPDASGCCEYCGGAVNG